MSHTHKMHKLTSQHILSRLRWDDGMKRPRNIKLQELFSHFSFCWKLSHPFTIRALKCLVSGVLPGGRQRNAKARMLQSIPFLSHQLLSLTVFCTSLVNSIIIDSFSASSPPWLCFQSFSTLFCRAPLVLTNISSDAFCMSVTPSTMQPVCFAELCVLAAAWV